ncbi:MAG: hypothetical protein HQL73_11245 [Magnetococcales bacterium]|nr:hypothetical protein [Magnetococcales bacterium]
MNGDRERRPLAAFTVGKQGAPRSMYPDHPAIQVFDPLSELLGTGSEPFIYTFDDAVKLAGHACPTIVGAFLLVKKALDILYPDSLPQRGDIAVTLPGGVDEGTLGPISQVFTLITGAAADNGFKGLGHHFGRMNLLRFQRGVGMSQTFTFERIATGQKVRLGYSPHVFPPDPQLAQLLPLVLDHRATPEERVTFGQLWRRRVETILADEGAHTITILPSSSPKG